MSQLRSWWSESSQAKSLPSPRRNQPQLHRPGPRLAMELLEVVREQEPRLRGFGALLDRRTPLLAVERAASFTMCQFDLRRDAELSCRCSSARRIHGSVPTVLVHADQAREFQGGEDGADGREFQSGAFGDGAGLAGAVFREGGVDRCFVAL